MRILLIFSLLIIHSGLGKTSDETELEAKIKYLEEKFLEKMVDVYRFAKTIEKENKRINQGMELKILQDRLK